MSVFSALPTRRRLVPMPSKIPRIPPRFFRVAVFVSIAGCCGTFWPIKLGPIPVSVRPLDAAESERSKSQRLPGGTAVIAFAADGGTLEGVTGGGTTFVTTVGAGSDLRSKSQRESMAKADSALQ